MGCWHQTDMLTQLPIRVGDPVRALIMRACSNLGDALGLHSPTALWEPLGLPIRGQYNDYGWIEPTEGCETALLRSFLGCADLTDPEIFLPGGHAVALVHETVYQALVNGAADLGEPWEFEPLRARWEGYLAAQRVGQWEPELRTTIGWLPGGDQVLALLADDQAAPIVRDWFFFYCGMHRTRKTFMPQAGFGAQTLEYELHAALLDAARGLISVGGD